MANKVAKKFVKDKNNNILCQWCNERPADCDAHIIGDGERTMQLFKALGIMKVKVPEDHWQQFDTNKSYGITCVECDTKDLRLLEEADNPLATLWKIAAFYCFALEHDQEHKMTQRTMKNFALERSEGKSPFFPNRVIKEFSLKEAIKVRDNIKAYITGSKKSKLITVNSHKRINNFSKRFYYKFPEIWRMMIHTMHKYPIGRSTWGVHESSDLIFNNGGAKFANKRSEYQAFTKTGKLELRKYPPRYLYYDSGFIRFAIEIEHGEPSDVDIVMDFFEDSAFSHLEKGKFKEKTWRNNNGRFSQYMDF